MSLLIKGMNMPKHCGECGIDWCHIWHRAENPTEKRPPDCPLSEVPTPHGDLIDIETVRKNLVEELQRNKDPFPYQSYYPSWNDAVIAMLSAPTIIQEEPESPNGER